MRYIGFHHLEESLYLDRQEELVLVEPLIWREQNLVSFIAERIEYRKQIVA